MKTVSPLSVTISPFRRPGLQRRFLLIGLLVPLSMDSKILSYGAGDHFKIMLLGGSLLCAFLYLMLEWLSANLGRGSNGLCIVATLWWSYLVLSPFPVIVWDVNFLHYLKILLPFTLYGLGLLVMLAAQRRRINPSILLDILLGGALFSVVWRVLFLFITGASFTTVRLQILGPGVPFLLGYGMAGLYLRRHPKLSAIALSTALVCVFVSITRSYIICAAFVMVGLLVIDARRRSILRMACSGGRFIFILTFIAMLAGTLAILVRPDFAVAWFGRLFHHQTSTGMDITLLIRLAEYAGQLDALTKNALTVLIGNGIGADYTWNTEILRALPFTVQNQTFWHAGHSTWVYPFFANGILLGMFLPFIFLWVLAAGCSAASVDEARGGARGAVLAVAVYLSYMGESFTANIFNEHWTGLILGIVSGILMVYSGEVKVKLSSWIGCLERQSLLVHETCGSGAH